MTITRVSTYANQQSLLRDTSHVQLDLSNLQNQVSSGLKASKYSELSGQVEQFSDLENKISRAKRYIDNNTIAVSRLETTANTLDSIVETVNGLKNLVVQRQSANTNTSLAYDEQIQAYWKTLSGQLNTTSEGRFLFSGTKTDVAPTDVNTFPSLIKDGTPDENYYKGNSDDISLRAQDNFDLKYNVRGNDPAFQNVIAGLVTARKGGNTSDPATLQKAYDLIQKGLDGIIGLQATVSTDKINITNINQRHDTLRLYWQGVKEQLVNTDLISASTQVATNQGILQASYQIFSRLSALRLSDFLR